MIRHILHILFVFLTALVAVLLCGAKPSALEFESREYDFGTIADSHEPVTHEYRFVNTLDEPVAVLSVSTGCGCTRPQYPIEPVKAGAKGVIKITFLPQGQRGEISKTIRVRYRAATARRSATVNLRLQGSVVPDKK